MRNKIFGVMLFFGAVMLSGCTTQEVRKESTIKDTLSFDKTQTATPTPTQQQPPTEEKVLETPPVVPPVTPPINTPVSNKKMYTSQPKMTIDAEKKYTATLKTDLGNIVVNLDESMPITVNNFVFLAKENFYDGTIFHRTIKGFMIQGGDPTGTGMGGPGYKFADEPFTGEYTRGTLAMANSGANTNGSQFFIMHKDTALPKSYIIFGHVTEGLDVVDKIAEAPTKTGGEGSSPVTPVTLQSVSIKEK